MWSVGVREFNLCLKSRLDDGDTRVDFNGMLSIVVAKIYLNECIEFH